MSSKLVLAGVLVFATIGILGGTYLLGSNNGKAIIRSEWNQEKENRNRAINDLEKEYESREAINRDENRKLASDLSKANQEHAVAITRMQFDFDKRLRSSETRAGVYQRQAEGGTVERASLASHAAELDRSLEQGRFLVRELGETVRQRDRQLEALSRQILNDRKLFNESGIANGQDASTPQ